MRKLIVGAAVAALVAGGTVAQAAPVARSAASVGTAEEMTGTPVLLGALGAVVLGLIVWQISEDDDEDMPTSP